MKKFYYVSFLIAIILFPLRLWAIDEYYDEQGRLIKRVLPNGGYDEYAYNENGEKTAETRYSCRNGSCSVSQSYQFQYVYDEQGRQKYEDKYWCQGDECRISSRGETIYDENGIKRAVEYSDCAYDPYRLYERMTFDEQGNAVSYVYDDPEVDWKMTDSWGDYDEYGNPRERSYSERSDMDGDGIYEMDEAEYTRMEYEYENGHIKTKKTYRCTDETCSSYYDSGIIEEYEYDEYGNLISRKIGSRVDTYSWANPAWKEPAEPASQRANRKRIYTVEKAERVSKPTGNTFRLRYK